MFRYCILGLLALLFQFGSVFAQETQPDDQYPASQDSLQDTTIARPQVPVPSRPDPDRLLKEQALLWVRRLIYRGFLDNGTTGTSATYALTEWNEISGPYGPAIAHVTVVYLGAITWLGKPAEWFQATFKSFENERPSVDFDLVVAGNGDRIGEAYRALWRLNKEELSAALFNVQSGQFDFDRDDQPRPGEQTVLKLYVGEFPVTKYIGAGSDGAKVIAYRASDVPPLGLVRLGYGNMSLNLRDRGFDVEPKLQVPLPTSR